MNSRNTIVPIFLGILLLICGNATAEIGNVDGIGDIDLRDAIISLQTCSGITTSSAVKTEADVDGDGKIGLAEAVYALQAVAQIRQPDGAPLILPTQSFPQSNIQIAYNPESETIRFMGAETGYAIAPATPFSPSVTAEEAGRAYLTEHGSFFGLTNQSEELTVMRSKTPDQERKYVRFQQKYNGIPIFGGEIIVEMDAAFSLMSISGELVGNVSADTNPLITVDAAKQIALERVEQTTQESVNNLICQPPELWIYIPKLLGFNEPSKNTLVWKIGVIDTNQFIQQSVFINAHSGIVDLQINEIKTVRNRMTYNASDPTNAILCRSENMPPSGDRDCDNVHNFVGDTYDFYRRMHNRDSIDNAGMTLLSFVHVPLDIFPGGTCNAGWGNGQMLYGIGCELTVDDIVAHEYTHGVTENESMLIYLNQSGAINESFSDIWGEFIDLTNGAGNDDPSVRWQHGEDSGWGASRDMRNPPLHGQPDRITSSTYKCVTWDNGGVHFNSGVGNKAAYLMTDGGTFNGFTITGLGLDKVVDLFYDVQTNRLTSSSTYPSLYNALISSCSSLGYSDFDCQQVRKAIDAVEMYIEPCRGPYYNVSGYVRDSSGNPISGITVTFSNNLGAATTNASGYYQRKVYSGWSGTVTPSQTGNTFTPLNRSYSSVTSNRISQNYTLSNACTSYEISPRSKSFDGGGGAGSVSVSASSGCSWSAQSNRSWIKINSGVNGSGNGMVTYSVDPNTTTGSRNGTITIADNEFLVSQTPCTYGISPRSRAFTSSGGNSSLSLITSSPGCDWTAIPSRNWIKITSASSGVGNSTISYSVEPNTGIGREGTITVGRQVYTITQDGADPCTSYTIFPLSQNFDGGGGTGSVNITASSGCNWSVTNNAPSFITITSSTVGSGSGTIPYSVAPNTTTATRVGTLTIADQTFTITQTPCTFNISPRERLFNASGGSDTISVMASSSGCNWTASSSKSWITITNGSGIGNGTVSYSVAPNPTTASRTGTITILRQTFTINQGSDLQIPDPVISLVGTEETTDGGGKPFIRYTISVSNRANFPNELFEPSPDLPPCGSVVDSSRSWVDVYNSKGENLQRFCGFTSNDDLALIWFGVAINDPPPEYVYITIWDRRLGTAYNSNEIPISPCNYGISPETSSVISSGGSGSFNVSAQSGCSWIAVSNSPWLTVTSNGSGTGSGSVFYSVEATTSTASRTGMITVAGKTFTVSQSGVTAPIDNLYLQNEIVTTTETYTSSNSIWAGKEVTTQKPYGDYVILSGGNVTLNSGTIYLKPGFTASEGSRFRATAQ
jgi:Zn-dependent metalloprotease